MVIDSFEALLAAARQQPDGQRLLLVFVRKVLSDAATPEQKAGFEAGAGGALVPVLYVDKSLGELSDFASLVAEAERTREVLGAGADRDWDMVLVGALGSRTKREPTSEEAKAPLGDILRALRNGGSLRHLAGFDRHGHPVRFD